MSSLDRDRAVWEHLGDADPLWAVCSRPERQGGRWSATEFFASGDAEVQSVLTFLSSRGYQVARDTALDFGCGAGRLSRALAGAFDSVVAVDISQAMLTEARRLNADLTNCDFVLNTTPDLTELPDGSFDMVLSLITLQHISDEAVVRSYLREFVRLLSPNGIAVFQLPASVPRRVRLHPLRLLAPRVSRSARDRWPKLQAWAMSLNALGPDDVSRTVGAAGGVVTECVEDRRSGSDAIRSLAYCVTRGSACAASVP